VLSEEEELFRRSVREFTRAEVIPRAPKMDREGRLDPELLPKLYDLGVMAIETPERFGGAGSSFFVSVLAVEEVSYGDASVGVVVDVQNTLVANALLRWGSEAQHAKFLPRMASGTLASYALSEAGSGSDAFALACRALPDGDGWRLGGRKLWITNAAEAGLFLVFASVDPDAGYKGITCFVVERGSAGLALGRKEDKLGIRASSTCELVLEGVRVPREHVLGQIGQGYRVAIETLNEGRIGIGAQMVGVAQRALDESLAYTAARKQFGRPVGDFQSVQFALARMATEIEAARLLVYDAARRKDAGVEFVKQAAMAKLFASEVAERATGQAVELFGGVGYTKDYPVEKLYRDAKIGKIYEGTSHMQLQTIARLVQKGS
jgi:butyryl-CoA dehydrogenase/short/branched chain acyl-CoA dehydrogenase